MGTIKLKSAEEIVKYLDLEFDSEINRQYYSSIIINAIKEAQREAVEKTLKIASENADADYNITESFDRITGENSEAYVINSSITSLKD